METDKSGNRYIELPLENQDKIRFSLIDSSWTGGPSIRIQIRGNDNGLLRQGPEIPFNYLGSSAAATFRLMTYRVSQKIKNFVRQRVDVRLWPER